MFKKISIFIISLMIMLAMPVNAFATSSRFSPSFSDLPSLKMANQPTYFNCVEKRGYFYDKNEPTQRISFSLMYDKNEKTIYSRFNNGILGIGFDYDFDDNYFYNPVNPWQRNFGYCKTYDDLAPFVGMHLDTVRFEFPYDGKYWMIQIWKGIYLASSGAEIGIYTKESADCPMYSCADDEDMLKMSMAVLADGNIYFERDKQPHWWLTGYVPFDIKCSDRLGCIFEIEFKTTSQRAAFKHSAIANGFIDGRTYFDTDQKTAVIVW